MAFSNLKSRKRDELPKFTLAPAGTYLFMCVSAKETVAKTGSRGLIQTFKIQEIGADVELGDLKVTDVQGKKMSTRFWLEDGNGETLDSAAFATQFLDAVYGEGEWDELLDAFTNIEGRLVRGVVSHRTDSSSGVMKVFADVSNFKPV